MTATQTKTPDQVTAEIRAELSALDNMPLPGLFVYGVPVTRAMLKSLFEMVENKTNWKKPIDAVVYLTPTQARLMTEAIRFYAGCVPSMNYANKPGYFDAENTWVMAFRVKAVGYYAAVGA